MTSPGGNFAPNRPNRRGPHEGSTSQYKGVSWKRRNGKWQAAAVLAGRTKYLGLFESEVDAAKAYDAFALEAYGYGAYLNFPTFDTSDSRQCHRCGAIKPLSAFDRGGKSGPCKACRSKAARASTIANAERVLDSHLRRTFGITLAQYNELAVEQGGVCAICRMPPSGRVSRLVVDHCHETGRVRGLLCKPCNSGIGHLRDSADVVRAALKYLEER